MTRLGAGVPALLFVSALACAQGTLRLPPGAEAATFDEKSFLVGGRRILLRSAGVPYFRIPPEEWRDRLLQTRLAGFNMVETPVPWNLHQPKCPRESPTISSDTLAKETFRFEGAADLGRFLDLCQEMKLLALVRIGPYVNAAVANGGLPAWLGDDPRLLVRSTDARFLGAVRAWWAKLLPIVAERQVPRGPVAMVQIEDHFDPPVAGYLPRLYEDAQEAGIRVPTALSTLNPSKGFERLPSSNDGLLLTTELMPCGPLGWGERWQVYPHFDTVVLEGVAKGLDGYSHPMWAGGTNFAVLPASSFPTRFEDSTCGLREGGAQTPVLADLKRANLFAGTFESVLTRAAGVKSHPLLDQARRVSVVGYGRTDGQTTVFFFIHPAAPSTLPLTDAATGQSAKLPVDERAFRHILVNYPLTDQVTLAFSTAQILCIQKQAASRAIVVYTPAGSEAVMVFKTGGTGFQPVAPAHWQDASATGLAWDAARKQLVLRWACGSKADRADFAFSVAATGSVAETIQIIAVEETQIARTHVLDGAGILVGAPGVGFLPSSSSWSSASSLGLELRFPPIRNRYEVSFYPFPSVGGTSASRENTILLPSSSFSTLTLQEPNKKTATRTITSTPGGRIDLPMEVDATPPTPVGLRKWETADLGPEATAAFDDSAWPESNQPAPMGQETAYGWYRCRFQASKAAPRKLQFENVADAVAVYLNGRFVGRSATKPLLDGPRNFMHPASLELPVAAGENVVAVLAKNWGQYRNAATYGVPLAKATAWGIVGNVLLDGRPLYRWRQRSGLLPLPLGEGRVSDLPTWETLRGGAAALESLTPSPLPKGEGDRPLRWYRTTFKLPKDPARLVPRAMPKGFAYGSLWINGHYAGMYQQRFYEAGHGYYLPPAWLRADNELVLLEEGGGKPVEAEIAFERDASVIPVQVEFK